MALLGLGTPAAAVAQCKQYVVQIPCEAEAGLHKLRTKLEGSTMRGLAQPLNQALNDLQVCTHEQMQITCISPVSVWHASQSYLHLETVSMTCCSQKVHTWCMQLARPI